MNAHLTCALLLICALLAGTDQIHSTSWYIRNKVKYSDNYLKDGRTDGQSATGSTRIVVFFSQTAAFVLNWALSQCFGQLLHEFNASVWWFAFCEFYSTCRISVYYQYIRNKELSFNIVSVSHFVLYGGKCIIMVYYTAGAWPVSGLYRPSLLLRVQSSSYHLVFIKQVKITFSLVLEFSVNDQLPLNVHENNFFHSARLCIRDIITYQVVSANRISRKKRLKCENAKCAIEP